MRLTAFQVKELVKEKLLEYPNITGVGIGDATIRIYLEKYDPYLMGELTSIAGFEVEYVVIGKLKPLSLLEFYPEGLYSHVMFERPILCGASVGHYKLRGAGTLGFVVERGSNKFCISCNHVLALASSVSRMIAKIGDPIIAPGYIDGGRYPDNEIGVLKYFKPLGSSRYSDSAYFIPLKSEYVSSEIIDIGKPNGFEEAKEGERVMKSGRTTGVTHGKVYDVHATVKVDYGYDVFVFDEQGIILGSFADRGDSGSAVLNDNLNIVGMVFAGSHSAVAFNKVNYVLYDLGIGKGRVPTEVIPPGLITVTGSILLSFLSLTFDRVKNYLKKL